MRPFSIYQCYTGLLAILLLTCFAHAQQTRFVYNVPDGVLESGVHYSARLEELEPLKNQIIMRFSFSSESEHMQSLPLFRGMCAFMQTRAVNTAEIKKHGDDTNIFVVQFPENLSPANLNDRTRVFITPEICVMVQPARN